MSNNIVKFENSYNWLSNIDSRSYNDKSVLLVGAGWMAKQYANALSQMKVKDVTVISRTQQKVSQLCDEFGFQPNLKEPKEALNKMERKDLTIIATQIESLLPMTKLAIESGQDNVLIEKPGSLYSNELLSLDNSSNGKRIRIAYNRLVYPNLHKLKQLVNEEGGITSCNFNFTERIHSIDFDKESKETFSRWGIANSLHIISMVLDLIGIPKQSLFYQTGKLDWHPTGSIFVGSGLSEKKIPFSYHADWGSSGRWGIEVMTSQNAYRLISLEELYICHKDSFEWGKIPFKIAYPKVKQGVAEEISLMLEEEIEEKIPLITLEKAAVFNQVAEKILGYESGK